MMAEVKLPYLHIYKDCRGKQRCYYNRRGFPKIPLPLPNENGFLEAYNEAKAQPKLKSKAPRRIRANTFGFLIASYKQSHDYLLLADETKKVYLRFLSYLEDSFGHLPAQLTRKQINQIRRVKKDVPTQANRMLSIIRLIYKNALQEDLVNEDPTIGLSNYNTIVKGHKTWSETNIAQYIDYWPLGTKEHLALQLILQTSQRRKDIVGFSFDTIKDNRITLNQSKTKTLVSVPVLPGLQAALDLLEFNTGPILRTSYGKPFTPNGFGNWFRETVRAAGLEGLSAHGLRKSMCTRLANAGCTAYEIMAISGHLTLSEVERYTREADMKRLSVSATDKLLNS